MGDMADLKYAIKVLQRATKRDIEYHCPSSILSEYDCSLWQTVKSVMEGIGVDWHLCKVDMSEDTGNTQCVNCFNRLVKYLDVYLNGGSFMFSLEKELREFPL